MAGRSPTDAGFSPARAAGTKMTAQAEARSLVAEIAGPLRLGENVKAALSRVARATGIGERRVRGFWNGEAKMVAAEEMDRLRLAAACAKAEAAAHAEAYAEFNALSTRIAAIEAALGLHDPQPSREVDHAAR